MTNSGPVLVKITMPCNEAEKGNDLLDIRSSSSRFGLKQIAKDRDSGAGGTAGASAPPPPPIILGKKKLKNYCFTAFMDVR